MMKRLSPILVLAMLVVAGCGVPSRYSSRSTPQPFTLATYDEGGKLTGTTEVREGKIEIRAPNRPVLLLPQSNLKPPESLFPTPEVEVTEVTPEESPIPGDANGNGVVGILDLTLVSLHLDQEADQEAWDSRADLTGPCPEEENPPCPDGKVDLLDLTLVLANFDPSQPEPDPISPEGQTAKGSAR